MQNDGTSCATEVPGEIVINGVPHVPEESGTTDESQDDVFQDTNGSQEDTNGDIDLTSVQLPPITRRRGKPKGPVNRVIGLPRKKTERDKEAKMQTHSQTRPKGVLVP